MKFSSLVGESRDQAVGRAGHHDGGGGAALQLADGIQHEHAAVQAGVQAVVAAVVGQACCGGGAVGQGEGDAGSLRRHRTGCAAACAGGVHSSQTAETDHADVQAVTRGVDGQAIQLGVVERHVLERGRCDGSAGLVEVGQGEQGVADVEAVEHIAVGIDHEALAADALQDAAGCDTIGGGADVVDDGQAGRVAGVDEADVKAVAAFFQLHADQVQQAGNGGRDLAGGSDGAVEQAGLIELGDALAVVGVQAVALLVVGDAGPHLYRAHVQHLGRDGAAGGRAEGGEGGKAVIAFVADEQNVWSRATA